jgi:F-type H+-transporting ATPase subunit gamma
MLLSRASSASRCLPRTAAAGTGARGFATEKELKKRMSAVKTIIKITKSTKMIAAAKFKAAEQAVGPARGLASPFVDFWKKVLKKDTLESPDTENPIDSTEKKYIFVPITADKGLCGAVNSSINRKLRRLLADKSNAKLFLVGDRAKSALARVYGKTCLLAMTGTSKLVPLQYPTSFKVADELLKNDADFYVYYWNWYKNAITYKTKITKLPGFAAATENLEGVLEYELEGLTAEGLKNLYEFTHAVLVHSYLAECGATEQSQRMTAMENSTKSAVELMDMLKLKYNRTRQARITTELVEIISGAIAVEDS